MVSVHATRALLAFLADELRLGLGGASGLEPRTRCELVGLVDDLVELAMGLDARPSPAATSPFDRVYEEVLG
jgi:hypothetical protein